MIDSSKLNTSFVQGGKNICVLAAYAIAHAYFTSSSPDEAFYAYCQQHRLLYGKQDAMDLFDTHHRGPRSDSLLGTERVLVESHQASSEQYFRQARAAFAGRVIYSVDIPRMEAELQRTESLLCIGILAGSGMTHVITIGAVPSGFVVRDTNLTTLRNAPGLLALLATFYPGHRYTDGAIYTRLLPSVTP